MDFAEGFLDSLRPLILNQRFDAIKENTSESYVCVEMRIKCYSDFFNVWSNALVPPANPLFKNMLLSEGYETPTNISADIATKLFNSDIDYSLINADPSLSPIWVCLYRHFITKVVQCNTR